MKLKIIALLTVVCLLLSSFALADTTAGAGKKGAVFRSTAPDAEGYFTTTLTLYDTEVRSWQFALRYDPAVAAPVDKTGQATKDFAAFAELSENAKWLMTLGTQLNAETGLIDFTCFMLPGVTASGVDGEGVLTVGQDGFEVYTFRFQKLKDGDPALQVATEQKGEPYQPACPQGVIAGGRDGEIPMEVSFVTDAANDTENKETFVPAAPAVPQSPAITAELLLKESILLPIGSHAAFADNGVTAIYPGEKTVTPYIKDSRTFVPLRFISERLKAEVAWDADTRTATITHGVHVIQIVIGEMYFLLDGEKRELDAPAEQIYASEGFVRTMVPLRFIAEALQYQVDWDEENRVAIVYAGSHDWDMSGTTEKQAVKNGLAQINMFKNFV